MYILKNRQLFRNLVIFFLGLFLCGCANSPFASPFATQAYLNQGKRDLAQGHYKLALKELLPLACDGIPQAQYAVGYLYYYGEGVSEDKEVGYFWIKRAAEKNYLPAQKALHIMATNRNES